MSNFRQDFTVTYRPDFGMPHKIIITFSKSSLKYRRTAKLSKVNHRNFLFENILKNDYFSNLFF